MPGGRPRKPTHLHVLNGTFRRDRHGRRPDAPRARKRGAELSPAQMTLLKEMPQLKGDARQHYIDIVTGAHWLEPVDRALLFAYVVACEMHSEASRELSRCMNDPAFSDPTTDISKAGIEYNKICSRQAQMIFRLSDELLLNPMARAKAGVEVRDASEPPNAWAKFLKIDGGRKDDPPA